jgi:predicted nuclease with TOPRIM domain
MREQLQSRLDVLKQEFETGQTRLREAEIQQSLLRERLLRISGAIQVLEELLEGTEPGEAQEECSHTGTCAP